MAKGTAALAKGERTPPPQVEAMTEKHIGTIEHYYPRAKAAVVDLEDAGMAVGDRIHIVGHGTDLVETVQSLQMDHNPVDKAAKGQHVGLHVDAPVHEKASVYLIK